MLTACAPDSNRQLERIDRLSENNPRLAREALDSIDRKSLASPDRHLYDLLDIKIDDKNYVTHKSDSIILDVVDYYSSLKNSPRYPEALYYAGRVYSDMGDSHTALKNYQSAVDELLENDDNLLLQGNAVAQTGNLLTNLGLYDQAVPYVMKSIRIDSIIGDTLNLIRDQRLLGSIYLYSEKYNEALSTFKRASSLANCFDSNEMKIIKAYSAACHNEKGEIDSALREIRNIPETIDSLSKNFALSIAAKIYLKVGKLDSAYIYSRQLVNSPYSNNRITGYSVMLSPELNQFIPSDSLYYYFNGYKKAIEEYHNRNQAESTITQNALYNYETHEKQRMKAEDENNSLKTSIFVLGSLVIIFGILYFFSKYRNNKKLLILHESLEKARLMKESPTFSSNKPGQFIGNTEKELRLKLQHELIEIFNKNKDNVMVPVSILESEIYLKISDLLKRDKGIPDGSDLWPQLEKEIDNTYPNFKRKLEVLTSGKLKEKSYHLAMLIKIGFKPGDTTTLMNKTKGTVSHYRRELVKSMFADKDTKDLDILIRLI